MHGGGSPDGAKMLINVKSDMNHLIKLARNIADIDEEIIVESKKR